jgi:hypothetical protein
MEPILGIFYNSSWWLRKYREKGRGKIAFIQHVVCPLNGSEMDLLIKLQ